MSVQNLEYTGSFINQISKQADWLCLCACFYFGCLSFLVQVFTFLK